MANASLISATYAAGSPSRTCVVWSHKPLLTKMKIDGLSRVPSGNMTTATFLDGSVACLAELFIEVMLDPNPLKIYPIIDKLLFDGIGPCFLGVTCRAERQDVLSASF